MLSANIIPFGFIILNDSFKKNGYFPFAASINTTSYFSFSVGSISTASPSYMFIFSSTSAFFMFSFASAILCSSLSIVSIVPFSAKNSVKHIAEYPTAVPISNIFSGFSCFKFSSITYSVSSIIIGIWSSNAFRFIFSSSFLFILLSFHDFIIIIHYMVYVNLF